MEKLGGGARRGRRSRRVRTGQAHDGVPQLYGEHRSARSFMWPVAGRAAMFGGYGKTAPCPGFRQEPAGPGLAGHCHQAHGLRIRFASGFRGLPGNGVRVSNIGFLRGLHDRMAAMPGEFEAPRASPGPWRSPAVLSPRPHDGVPQPGEAFRQILHVGVGG